jgi:hypothetical protein
MSKFAVPAEERILSDKFFEAVNPRRVLCELIAYQDNVIADNEAEAARRRNSGKQSAKDRAHCEAMLSFNYFVRNSLSDLVEHGSNLHDTANLQTRRQQLALTR